MGYSSSLFWESSLQEIFDLVESFNRKKEIERKDYEAKLKTEIMLNTVLAKQIGEYVACLFNKNAKVTPPTKLFPELFEEENKEFEKKNLEIQMQLHKNRMHNLANRLNSSKRREGK